MRNLRWRWRVTEEDIPNIHPGPPQMFTWIHVPAHTHMHRHTYYTCIPLLLPLSLSLPPSLPVPIPVCVCLFLSLFWLRNSTSSHLSLAKFFKNYKEISAQRWLLKLYLINWGKNPKSTHTKTTFKYYGIPSIEEISNIKLKLMKHFYERNCWCCPKLRIKNKNKMLQMYI